MPTTEEILRFLVSRVTPSGNGVQVLAGSRAETISSRSSDGRSDAPMAPRSAYPATVRQIWGALISGRVGYTSTCMDTPSPGIDP